MWCLLHICYFNILLYFFKKCYLFSPRNVIGPKCLISLNLNLPQLIDCSMSLPDDPKEPHFFSVLPWILLHHVIKQEEGSYDCMMHRRMSVEDEDGEGVPLA